MRVHNWRRFNVLITLFFILSALLVGLINIIIDPYQVFGVLNLKAGYAFNERYNKIEHLITHPGSYDSYLLGSSKIGLVDPAYAEIFRPNRRYYNLGVFGGHAGDALLMLKALKEKNVQIKEVVFGIDIFPYLTAASELTPAYRHHPDVSGISRFDFFSRYVFVPSLFHSFMKVSHLATGAQDIVFDIKNTGHYSLLNFEKMIKVDHSAYNNTHFKVTHLTQVNAVWVEDQFRMLSELKTWLETNNIQVYFFIQPHHRLDYVSRLSPKDKDMFIKRIESITGVIPNFMDKPQWSDVDNDYYDTKHYRPVLAEKIFLELYNRNEQTMAAMPSSHLNHER